MKHRTGGGTGRRRGHNPSGATQVVHAVGATPPTTRGADT